MNIDTWEVPNKVNMEKLKIGTHSIRSFFLYLFYHHLNLQMNNSTSADLLGLSTPPANQNNTQSNTGKFHYRSKHLLSLSCLVLHGIFLIIYHYSVTSMMIKDCS